MIVQTCNGKIKGYEKQSIITGKKYFSFSGVPYAKPPIGDLRFSAPAPLENWDGIYDATYERNQCCQKMIFILEGISGSDDCLYMNIHTRDVNPSSLKPVLFYIHGGGFCGGSGSNEMFGEDYIMNYDVVSVFINYRVHILGFLNLGIPECPGNAGLKDQVMALQWVIQNIKAFGGDPNNITINGCSAGGASVNFLMISPLANGLFQKAIAECGTALSTYSLTHEPLKWAFEAGKKLGFTGDDRLELLKFFRILPAVQLATVAAELLDEINNKEYRARALYCPFSPSVEVIKEGAFLPDYPKNLVKTAAPVPCIVGYAELEQVFIGKYIIENLPNASQSMIATVIKDNFKVTEFQLTDMVEKLTEFYFHKNDQSKTNVEKMCELLTDICCLQFYDSFKFVSKSNVPAYVFHFTYFSENNEGRKKLTKLFPDVKKPFHGEETRLLMVCKIFDPQPIRDGVDAFMQKNTLEFWINFMKTGTPSTDNEDIVWKPHTIDEPCYLQIDPEFKMRKGKISEKRMEFLSSLFQNVQMLG